MATTKRRKKGRRGVPKSGLAKPLKTQVPKVRADCKKALRAALTVPLSKDAVDMETTIFDGTIGKYTLRYETGMQRLRVWKIDKLKNFILREIKKIALELNKGGVKVTGPQFKKVAIQSMNATHKWCKSYIDKHGHFKVGKPGANSPTGDVCTDFLDTHTI